MLAIPAGARLESVSTTAAARIRAAAGDQAPKRRRM
jgi:hypothetical protein